MTAVGIDVGKAALDMAVEGVAGVARFANTPVGIGKLIGRLKGVADARVVVEAELAVPAQLAPQVHAGQVGRVVRRQR